MQIFREFSKKLEERLCEKLNFIQVVTGPRQVGKTTGLRQVAERWRGPCHVVSADEVAPPSAGWRSPLPADATGAAAIRPCPFD